MDLNLWLILFIVIGLFLLICLDCVGDGCLSLAGWAAFALLFAWLVYFFVVLILFEFVVVSVCLVLYFG